MGGFERDALRARLYPRMIVRDQTGAEVCDVPIPQCTNAQLWAAAAFAAIKGWVKGDSVITSYDVR